MVKEVWKDINGYEGLYQASNLGNIKSKNRILKQMKRKDGYYSVNLSKNGKAKPTKVHRIIAQTFIENKNNYNIINHKDNNKENNCVENLEWCTQSYNIKEAYRCGARKPVRLLGKNNPKSKSVIQYDLYNNYIKKWDCINEASKKLKIKDSNISLVCKGKRKTAGGYIWRYVDEEFNN